MQRFVIRERELVRLEAWWRERDAMFAMVWGRRRVGKTALVQQFSKGKPVVYHTGTGRPLADELRALSRLVGSVADTSFRDLAARPFADWERLSRQSGRPGSRASVASDHA